MVWTAPRTWVTAETVTAALMNTHIRDNLLVTAPGIATAAGKMIVTSGTNLIVERTPAQDVDAGSGTGTNTSYLTLANLTGGTPFGGEVEVAATTGTDAIVFIGASVASSTAGAITRLSYSVSGATTIGANNDFALSFESPFTGDHLQAATFHMVTTLTGGSNTFTLEGLVSAGTGTWAEPRICVVPL